MFVITGSVLFGLITIFNFLICCGLPLGEFTMGGRYKVLPGKLRILAVFSLPVQLFAILILLQAGGYITMWFSDGVTKYVCIFFAVYLSLNTIMNLFSTSKKERYVITPLSLISAVCFWVTAMRL